MRLANLNNRRRAFSLLEMVLALAIGMLLLLALYGAFNTYITHAQSGREVVAEGVLARNILMRIANDITGQLGPDDPRLNDYPPPDPPIMAKFNRGVYGKNGTLILSGYRVRKLAANVPTDVPEAEVNSDLRRVYYWIVGNGGDPLGLARAEFKQATNPDIDTLDGTGLPDQNKYIIAPEVKTILFEYYDGTSWATEWDGLNTPADGAPPFGPPAGIRITITFRRNANKGLAPDDPNVDGPTYQHVVAVPAANNFPSQTTK